MYQAFPVHVAQCINNKADWAEDLRRGKTREHADVRAFDELLAEDRRVGFGVEFKSSYDVRMHQPNAGLPFSAQSPGALRITRRNFECNGCARQAILSEPRMSIAISAQSSNERVSIG